MNQKNDILLVEDDLDDAELTILGLKKNNLINELLHFKRGQEVLDYVFATGIYSGRNINHVPKMIILDIKMPQVGGLEVLDRIKSDKRTRIIPVVLLTSSQEDKDIAEGYRLGANSYIVKPVGFENFMKVISDIGLYWLLTNQPPR